MRNLTTLTRFHRSGWIIYLLVILLLLSISCKLQPAPETPPAPPDPAPAPQPANSAPIINYMTAQEEVAPLSESEIHCVATDKDNDSLTYSWLVSAGTINGEGEI